MICPNCGMEVADGSFQCPTCGAALQQPYQADPMGAPMGMPYQTAPMAQPKKKTGLIVGIIAAVVAVAAIVVCCIIFLGGKGKVDGKYVCDNFKAFGVDMYIEINGDSFTMATEYDTNGDGTISADERESETGSCKVDGDTITLTVDGESIACAYDKKAGTITMSEGGISLVFTKKK